MGTGISKIIEPIKYEAWDIVIHGIVQGVGFRPFIYRLALEEGLRGWVLNNSQGVRIRVYDTKEVVEEFAQKIPKVAPVAASITDLAIEAAVLSEGEVMAEDFTIKHSDSGGSKEAYISPDLAMCKDCYEELMNPRDRRYGYPFINCTNCGPRFSIVEDIPYDRSNTTMKEFPMCEPCLTEYENPLDRRFHAQPNACEICGPSYTLCNFQQEIMANGQEAIEQARKLLRAGKILAIKGIGGYHLACDAYNEVAVATLRARKHREDKALAIMVTNFTKASKLAKFSIQEQDLWESVAAPIVLLEKSANYDIPEVVAPNNAFIGIMKAYAPVHYLLMGAEGALVMTSANLSSEPIIYKDNEVFEKLGKIADFALIHNRKIRNRIDDSVIRCFNGENSFIRRSRGYAPTPIDLPMVGKIPSVFAVGGELKNTFAFSKDQKAFVSHHMGDLENQPSNLVYKDSIELYKRLFALEPEVVAYDLHPEYFSTKVAKDLPLVKIPVQHHHAHIASVLAEHKVAEKVIGVALDGTGYGTDGTLWGGEFMVADMAHYERLGTFPQVILPGGFKAIKEPWRLALWKAKQLWPDTWQQVCPNLVKPESLLLLTVIEKALNCPITTSAGRAFDLAAALLGLREKINYEGQAAIELERIAQEAKGEVLPFKIVKSQELWTMDLDAMYRELPKLKLREGLAYGAMSVHRTLAAAIVTMLKKISDTTGIATVVFSGGVCQNITLLSLIKEQIEKDFTILLNRKVPANDGGLAYGQLAVARARYALGEYK